MIEDKKKLLILGATSSEISTVEGIQQMGETGHLHSLGRSTMSSHCQSL